MADAAAAPTIRTFQVFPDVPAALEPLLELAHNLWWVWNPDAVELFRRLDRKLWDDVYHNPVKMLGSMSQDKLATAARDEGYLAHMHRVYTDFKPHRAAGGRLPLSLLDTNLQENAPADRDITSRLYGGGTDMRIKQELVLGIGGVRALAALNITPTVFHMNEGHSAFLALERIRTLLEGSPLTFDEARQQVMASSVFTTHTPVPAGVDTFFPGLIPK